MPTSTITITNDGHNMFRDSISGGQSSFISFVALGTGTATPTVNDHTLTNETFRKVVTSFANGSGVGEILISMYLSPTDLVGSFVQEVGFYGGYTATASANTGILLAHGLWTIPGGGSKTNLQSIVFTLDFTS